MLFLKWKKKNTLSSQFKSYAINDLITNNKKQKMLNILIKRRKSDTLQDIVLFVKRFKSKRPSSNSNDFSTRQTQKKYRVANMWLMNPSLLQWLQIFKHINTSPWVLSLPQSKLILKTNPTTAKQSETYICMQKNDKIQSTESTAYFYMHGSLRLIWFCPLNQNYNWDANPTINKAKLLHQLCKVFIIRYEFSTVEQLR